MSFRRYRPGKLNSRWLDIYCGIIYVELFLSVAGGRTHIGTYVGVSPSPASNENNLRKKAELKFFWEQKRVQLLQAKNFNSAFFMLVYLYVFIRQNVRR